MVIFHHVPLSLQPFAMLQVSIFCLLDSNVITASVTSIFPEHCFFLLYNCLPPGLLEGKASVIENEGHVS